MKRFILVFLFYPIRHSWFYLFIFNLPFVIFGGFPIQFFGLKEQSTILYETVKFSVSCMDLNLLTKTYPKACRELIPCFMFWMDGILLVCAVALMEVLSGFGCIAWYLWGVFRPKHGNTTSKCWKERHSASDYVPWKWAIRRQPACRQCKKSTPVDGSGIQH
jgi:uncharacterized membrane-anchored protein YitT (DUF2179 family)